LPSWSTVVTTRRMSSLSGMLQTLLIVQAAGAASFIEGVPNPCAFAAASLMIMPNREEQEWPEPLREHAESTSVSAT
jgi:hypothetical protein